jgi:predicted nucleic acid-binding protein
MRSRSFPEQAGVVLGAAVEGIWCGGLAAALTGVSALLLIVFAWITVLAAALLARRFGAGAGRERPTRLLAMTLSLAAAGVLLVADRAWVHPSALWQVVRDVVYSGGLVALGLYLGSSPQSPETAVRRAVRAFGLLCAVLAFAALAGSVPGWAPWAVVAALVVGGLLVAIVRYQTLTDLVDPVERLPAWPWLLAVVGAVLVVVATGALLSQVLRVEVVLWALSVLTGVLRDALAGVAYLVGYAALELAHGIAWLLGALHLHVWHPGGQRQAAPTPTVLRRLNARSLRVWSGSRLLATAVAALVAVALSFALVAVALRRFRREPPAQVMVVEERETLASLRSAAGVFAARLRRRLRRRLLRPRRPDARTPAELVRRRYAELERRLSRGGRPRLPGVTVRDHLAAVAAPASGASAPAAPAPGAGDEPAEGVAAPSLQAAGEASASTEAEPALPLLAADLAAIYELARYSAHAIDAAQAGRFEVLARAFMA